jgi:hypothetical protein
MSALSSDLEMRYSLKGIRYLKHLLIFGYNSTFGAQRSTSVLHVLLPAWYTYYVTSIHIWKLTSSFMMNSSLRPVLAGAKKDNGNMAKETALHHSGYK